MRAFMLTLLACAAASTGWAASPTAGDWPTYGRDPGGQRHSPLDQITPANVGRLKPAWTYHMRPAGPVSADTATAHGGNAAPARLAGSETTPLVVDGVMYVGTPYNRVVALEAHTGRELWAQVLPNGAQPATRGIEYWPGDGTAGPRLFVGTRDGKLMALDARTGALVREFGEAGVLELRTPEILNGYPDARLAMNSPPLVFRNLVITGSATQERPALGARGDVRAWDARTGKLAWTFHSVPLPGQPFHETWEGDGWKGRSGVNVWSFLTLDVERGVVYMPFGAPAWDRYGGDRKGSNLFSSSVVAADAATGRYLWHFQTVHHDIWDHDIPAPPALIEVKRGAETIPGLAVVNKTGLLFLLDRRDGKPIYEVRETPVPPSTVPGEEAWPTQPVPVKPPPLTRDSFTRAEIADVTPQLKSFCTAWFDSQKMAESKPFSTLPFETPIVRFPGSGGGVNWAGGAFDRARGLYIVNTMDLGSVEFVVRDKDGGIVSGVGPDSFFADWGSRMPCQKPPWGSLTAVNVDTGDIAWRVNLGVTDSLPEGQRDTGRPNLGGPILTASGLVFIGATDDRRFRAFDARTGQNLWTVELGAAAHATPITYLGKDRQQYVAVTATGGTFLASPVTGDEIIAFSLNGKGELPRPQPAPAPPAPAVAAAAVNTAPVVLPDEPRKQVLERACSSCHAVEVAAGKRRTPEEWRQVIGRMQDYGAPGTPADFDAIHAYLSQHASSRAGN